MTTLLSARRHVLNYLEIGTQTLLKLFEVNRVKDNLDKYRLLINNVRENYQITAHNVTNVLNY